MKNNNTNRRWGNIRLTAKGFTAIFILILALMFLADIAEPDKSFSERENRYLAEKPTLSAAHLLNGTFETDYETYIDDQFLWRDGFVNLKGLSEAMLLKGENNAIIFGKDGYLFNKYLTLPDQYEKNINAIAQFAQNYPEIPIHVLIAPNSYAVLDQKMPEGVMNVDEIAVLNETKQMLESGSTNLDCIETASVLNAHEEAYLYYRSDHHWTTEGAYWAYTAYCKAEGIEPVSLSAYTPHEVPGFYGTLYASAGRLNGDPDVITYYDIPGAYVTLSGEGPLPLYDLSDADGRDKYGLFLYNNPSQMTVFSGKEGVQPLSDEKKTRLLVIKDSYANCFLPFLTAHYDEMEVVDLRYFNRGISALMEEDWDAVLILYNFIGFSEDNNLIKLMH